VSPAGRCHDVCIGMTAVIEIEGLRKEYRRRKGRTVAVDGLDLSVPEGSVFGFLGPNGSGKTTTIRMLLGLVRPTAGKARLFGEPVPAALPHVIRRVGSIVEAPALFPTMSGRENLRLLARIDGIGRREIERVLEQVGLADRAGDMVRKYSLGMRQRLALGAALLKDPALVVLDEPANGLDPAGIRQVRELLRSLGREGRTVFVSSHILAEIEHTCDSLAILTRGRCVAQGSVASVLASAGPSSLVVRVDDLDAGLHALRRAAMSVERVDGHLRVDGAVRAGDVTRVLAGEQLWVTEMHAEERSLEDLFLELTDTGPPVETPDEPDAVVRDQLMEVV
jgi:ABC-type multidrug transport system ATPase subunit